MTNRPELKHPSLHRTWVEVDLDAIEANLHAFQALVGPQTRILAPVKADAYGHGAVPTARALLRAGAARLAVATAAEGAELRQGGIAAPIQVLGALLPEEVEEAVAHGLTLSLHELDLARLASLAAADLNRTASVHLKIDTGMGRLGILPADAGRAAAEIARYPHLRLEGVFMHFAEAADEAYSREQIRRFEEALAVLDAAGVQGLLRHAANSTAAILYPESRYDFIRPGLGLYGMHDPAWTADRLPLRPALTWKCLVIQVKDYPPGHSLGYNRTFTTTRPTRVAVLPLGYADGYQRAYSNRADVLIHGRRARVVGMVSMDYAMADVTGLDNVTVGTDVTLLGADGDERIPAEELAALGGDVIPYEITTRIGPRVGRCHVRHARPDGPTAQD